MTADPRAALTSLVAALERHLEVASSRRDPDDPAVVSAAEELTDAFFDYDEALFEVTTVTTPLDGPYEDDDDDDEDEDEDEDEDDDEDEDLEDDYDEVDEDDLDDDDDIQGDELEGELEPDRGPEDVIR
jgi:hypothetical protein